MQPSSAPHENKAKNGELAIVATPIGNLRDITLRALDVLKHADLILCEDTRHSAKLLSAHGIGTATWAYHEHNAAVRRPQVIEKLESGQRIALISDAGTPLISDPGYKLVQEARQRGIAVTPLPGACAAITALCAAGLPTDQFHFIGFLPPKMAARRSRLEALRAIPGTLVFYESPQRILDTLIDAEAVLGEREAVVARELTKSYEEFRGATLSALIARYRDEPTPKGEIVLLIGAAPADAGQVDDEEIERRLRQAMADYPLKEAAGIVAEAIGRPKRELYQWALRLKDA
jgi:16S rRNA (cytidine1402-2'-O)-methyltransferase